jgi:phosphomannomutase
MDLAIFRAYDIRGTYDVSINQLTAYMIGVSFANLTLTEKNSIIYVGRDCRLSSPDLFNALCQGLIDGGYRVISIGVVSSPMLYFADVTKKPVASIMITGSHNKKEDNGFKILHNCKSFYGEQITQLRDAVKNCSLTYHQQDLKLEIDDVYEQYIKSILQDIKINPNFKVVWDTGNGAAGKVVESLIKKLPNHNLLINGEMNGNFPNHHPDPTVPLNLKQLKSKVLETGSDLGVAFDGDGDRIGVISATGEFIYADILMCVFAQDLLEKDPGASIVCDIKSTMILESLVKKMGGKIHISKTGCVFVKELIKDTNAVFGGELSGHLFFKDRYYGYDDGVYAALRLIELLSNASHSLQEIVDRLPKTFSSPEIRIECSNKFEVIESIKQKLEDKNYNINTIDGVRVDYNREGWWLIRASNTEEFLVLRFEAISKEALDKIKAEAGQIFGDLFKWTALG